MSFLRFCLPKDASQLRTTNLFPTPYCSISIIKTNILFFTKQVQNRDIILKFSQDCFKLRCASFCFPENQGNFKQSMFLHKRHSFMETDRFPKNVPPQTKVGKIQQNVLPKIKGGKFINSTLLLLLLLLLSLLLLLLLSLLLGLLPIAYCL